MSKVKSVAPSYILNLFPDSLFKEATKSKKINIKSIDIRLGIADSYTQCVIARAACRQFGLRVGNVYIMRTNAFLIYPASYGQKQTIVKHRLSNKARKYALLNDRAVISSEPFECILGPIPPSERVGSIRKRGTKRGPHLVERQFSLLPGSRKRVGKKALKGVK